MTEHHPALVVGSGLAGLTAALSLAPLETLVVTKTDAPRSGSTPWAQGGVAFPRDEADEASHIEDTLVSGGGHTDPEAARALVERAPQARAWLEAQGVRFDRDESGAYLYGREGAHSARRILHVGADSTGAGLAQVLGRRLQEAPHVRVRPRTLAVRLVPGGVLTLEEARGLVFVASPRVILAGGGLGQLFSATTAPPEATGDTIALALEAGIPVSDLEMVQYHPTALALRLHAAQLSLLTEALRGEGALLVTASSPEATDLHPLDTGHALGSLGPRDVLSRAIFRRRNEGFPVWLDARSVPDTALRFPTVTELCARAGLNPARDLLPVMPAVHYTMGGVNTDGFGRTGQPGVWAVGETARTGVHGANRLASNSLLECVVWGRAAAESAQSDPETPVGPEALWPHLLPPAELASDLRPRIQAAMTLAAGPIRDARGLTEGLRTLAELQTLWTRESRLKLDALTFDHAPAILETRNLLLLGPALLNQALARTESLGAHHRGD